MAFNFDVIILGTYSIDFIFSGLPEMPSLGNEVVGTEFNMTPGESYITAVALHRLGVKVGWAVDFGNDEFSRHVLQCARQEGLDESLFAIHDRPYRRISVATSFPAERGFITYYDPDPQVPAAVPALFKSNARVAFIPALYTGKFFDAGRRIIQAKKMRLFMDGNSSSGDIFSNSKESKAIRKVLKQVDVFIPNAPEARRLTGEQELELAIYRLGMHCPIVTITDGKNGSLALENNKLVRMPAIKIEAHDTTGAGDNFDAGFIYAWLDGQSIENCLKWGNVLGGLSITELGGTTRKISSEEVKKYISTWDKINNSPGIDKEYKRLKNS